MRCKGEQPARHNQRLSALVTLKTRVTKREAHQPVTVRRAGFQTLLQSVQFGGGVAATITRRTRFRIIVIFSLSSGGSRTHVHVV